MYNNDMGYRYRNSREYIIKRQNDIFKHKQKRKNRKYSLNRHYKTPSIKVPLEIRLWANKGKRDKDVTFKLPTVFSLTDSPSETIKVLKNIAKVFTAKEDLRLKISCKRTESFDLSALIVLSSIIVKGEKYLIKKGYKCNISGDYPNNIKCRELFIYSGLPRHLNCIDPKDEDIKILNPFETIKNTSLESMRIVEYYNDCLNKNGLELNEKGNEYFYNLVNEVIDNALIHSGYKDIVYCGGYYNNRDKSVQISILSYGNSMYESLSNEKSSKMTKNKLEEITDKHRSYFDTSYTKENLWTVLALQYKVSRYSDNENNRDRGTGTIKFIEAFMNVGNTYANRNQRVSLMSGNTLILFDGKYQLGENTSNDDYAKIIAFNKENDLFKKPDCNNVKNVSSHFPGVAINLEIFIDKDYLKNKGGEKDGK